MEISPLRGIAALLPLSSSGQEEKARAPRINGELRENNLI
jgi:hypothetical protein